MKEAKFSSIGFVLAAAGSAVGLGNIWRFPYITGEYGGGAFVLIYICAILCAALPLMIAEMLIGKMTKQEPIAAFEQLAPADKKYWRFAGLQLFTSLIILTFYAVVIGWVLSYLAHSIFALPTSGEESKMRFTNFLRHDIGTQLLCHAFAVFATALAVLGGVKKGIERANNIMMPLLFITLFFLFCYAISLPSFGKAISFMFAPDFSKIGIDAVLVAIGQSFFSMSVGMAILITYSAASGYIRITRSALTVSLIDTAIAMMAGVAAFTFLFNENLSSGQGAGLAFISMPVSFASLGIMGNILAFLFFLALLFASLTSSISILEPTTAFLIRRYGFSRRKATWIPLIFVYFAGVVILLSNVEGFEFLSLAGMPLFDFIDFFTAAIMLPLGALFMAIFIGFIADRTRIRHELLSDGLSDRLVKGWFFTIRFVAPIAIAAVVIAKVIGVGG